MEDGAPHVQLNLYAPPLADLEDSPDAIDKDSLPPVLADTSFWAMTWTAFFGAFNDNLYEQLLLLTVISMTAATAAATHESGNDGQFLVQFVFAIPFVIFSGFAGTISDRNSKRTIVILTKWAEIAVTLLGVVAFLLIPWIGTSGIIAVLFLLTTHSTFYGPAKYGILPEMLRENDLPRATSVMLLFTFLAIIGGTAAGGLLLTLLKSSGLEGQVWIAQFVCVGVAVLGCACSYFLREVPVADPDLEFRWSDCFVPQDTLALLWSDRPLLWGVLASCMFWSAGVIVKLGVNAFGKLQLHLSDMSTSILTAAVAVGIMLGSIVAGFFPERLWGARLVTTGAWGIVLSLAALTYLGHSLETLPDAKEVARLQQLGTDASHDDAHKLIGVQLIQSAGVWRALPLLILMGAATGLFIVPIQVFLQARPPAEQKGRMIAAQAFFNWLAMSVSALLYGGMEVVLGWFDWPRSATFALTAALILPIALFYTIPCEVEPAAEKEPHPEREK